MCRGKRPSAFVFALLRKHITCLWLPGSNAHRRGEVANRATRSPHNPCINETLKTRGTRRNHVGDQAPTVGDVNDLPRRRALDHFRGVLLQRPNTNGFTCHVRQSSTYVSGVPGASHQRCGFPIPSPDRAAGLGPRDSDGSGVGWVITFKNPVENASNIRP